MDGWMGGGLRMMNCGWPVDCERYAVLYDSRPQNACPLNPPHRSLCDSLCHPSHFFLKKKRREEKTTEEVNQPRVGMKTCRVHRICMRGAVSRIESVTSIAGGECSSAQAWSPCLAIAVAVTVTVTAMATASSQSRAISN